MLADTCNVAHAAKSPASRSAMPTTSKHEAAFRAAWLEAIGTAYSRLELVLLDRAFNGTEKVVTRKDGSEERMLEYSNQLGLQLLKMHRDTATEAEVELSDDHLQEVRERLFKSCSGCASGKRRKPRRSEALQHARADAAVGQSQPNSGASFYG